MFDVYDLESLMILSPNPEFKAKVSKEAKDNFEIVHSDNRTYIIAVAVHKERTRNSIARISCKKGLPIGGYIYDSQSDCYHIECADYLHLGFTPLSFLGKMKGLVHWEIRIPMPENVIRKCLTSTQRKDLKNFKNHFKSDEYDIQFIQMIDAN